MVLKPHVDHTLIEIVVNTLESCFHREVMTDPPYGIHSNSGFDRRPRVDGKQRWSSRDSYLRSLEKGKALQL